MKADLGSIRISTLNLNPNLNLYLTLNLTLTRLLQYAYLGAKQRY